MRLIDADALKRNWTGIDTPVGYRKVVDLEVIDNAPTVEYPEQITVECDTEEDKQKLLSALRNVKLKAIVEDERPQGEWLIIDDTEQFIAKCSVCGRIEDSRMVKDYPFCHCGANMTKEAEND